MKHRKHGFHFQTPKGENYFEAEDSPQVGGQGVGALGNRGRVCLFKTD